MERTGRGPGQVPRVSHARGSWGFGARREIRWGPPTRDARRDVAAGGAARRRRRPRRGVRPFVLSLPPRRLHHRGAHGRAVRIPQLLLPRPGFDLGGRGRGEHHERSPARRLRHRVGGADARGRGAGGAVSERRGRHRPGDEQEPRPGEPAPFETPEAVLELQPETAPAPGRTYRPGRVHLVVVVTRAVTTKVEAPPGAMLIARFWHPSLRRWSETPFESLEHALHLFVDESGWVLRQQQALD